MMYLNLDTMQQGRLIAENDKYKTVMLLLETGKAISISTATFHRKWIEIMDTTKTIKEEIKNAV